ncbi:MAG: hypothetical protein ACLGI7_17115 [Gammaproteobacteria bacterium]
MRTRTPGAARCARWLLGAACGLAVAAAAVAARQPVMDSAAELKRIYAGADARLRKSPFKRPLYLESSEADGRLAGNVYARVDHDFAALRATLGKPASWCDVLALAPNIRQCAAAEGEGEGDAGAALAVRFGRRYDQPADAAYPVDFDFAVEATGEKYFRARLAAAEGPLGTEDYDILIEAIPADGGSFLHFRYAYAYGLSARIATSAYLSTKGHDKVGFTVAGTGADGQPRYVGGLRGAAERNAMRYYLAIDAYLGAADVAPAQRFEASLVRWLDAIEQYPRQLAEVDREAYLAVKREQGRAMAMR